MNSLSFRAASLESSVIARLLIFAALILAETFVLSVRFDTANLARSYKLLMLMGHSGDLLKLAVTMAGVLVILGVYRFRSIHPLVQDSARHASWKFWLAVHLVCFCLFAVLTWFIFKYSWRAGIFINAAVLLWFAQAAATFIPLLFAISPPGFWRRLVAQEEYFILAASVLGFMAWFLGREFVYYSAVLNEWTFAACYRVLDLFFAEPFVDLNRKSLGVSSFVVEIRPDCSGYEGIGLIIVFLGIYLWLYRDVLRMPHALLLFPLGVLAIWTLNVLRIVALIAIGAFVSEPVALGGFHSNAGWIAFVATGLGLIWLTHRSSFFSGTDRQPAKAVERNAHGDAATALLFPFVALLATILVTQAFVSEFDWFYPARVIVCALVLWAFRDQYRALLARVSLSAVGIGGVVFVIWIYLVPHSVEDDRTFALALFSTDSVLSTLWIAFRALGAIVTVPIIEELAFRGYVINKLAGQKSFDTFGRFTLLSFVLSSVLFGLLHGQWLAGTLAGMAFAGALYMRRQLPDAVVAHATTNALLTVYVLYTGHWSLW